MKADNRVQFRLKEDDLEKMQEIVDSTDSEFKTIGAFAKDIVERWLINKEKETDPIMKKLEEQSQRAEKQYEKLRNGLVTIGLNMGPMNEPTRIKVLKSLFKKELKIDD